MKDSRPSRADDSRREVVWRHRAASGDWLPIEVKASLYKTSSIVKREVGPCLHKLAPLFKHVRPAICLLRFAAFNVA